MLRRAFIDLPHGQLHYWRGEIRNAHPLIMLHGSPGSSYSLLPYAKELSQWRDVLVLDTPGNGDSSPAPSSQPTIEELALIIGEALAAVGIQEGFIYGYHTGASLAISLAHQRPALARGLILEGVSFFSEEERTHLMKNDHAPQYELRMDGAHLSMIWDMVKSAHIYWPWWNTSHAALRDRDLPDARNLHYETLQVLKAVETYHLSYRAALAFDKAKVLAQLDLPILATCSRKDQLWPSLQSVSRYCPSAVVKEVPGFDTPEKAQATSQIFGEFLRTSFE